jgi:hypothetical protein
MPAAYSIRLVAFALLFIGSAPLAAQVGTVRGVVTDTAGRPIRGVEVVAIREERSVRTDAEGRFTINRLPWGQVVIMARLPGWRAAERAVTIGDAGQADVTFELKRVIQLIDTLRITSHDGCAAYRLEGFECRRRAGIGQFRGPEEINALRPVYWSDLFEGFTGLRRVPFQNQQRERDWTVMPTSGWRCLNIGMNGREPTAAEQVLFPKDIYAIEFFDVYERVPEPYKRLSWPGDRPEPCSLIMYWTKAWVTQNGRPPR